MRLAVSLSLVVLLVFNLFGFYVVFFASRENIKTEVEKRVAMNGQSSLERFEFTCGQFGELVKPDGEDNEVIINDFLYDVKSVASENGKVIVLARKDTPETDLVNRFLVEVTRQSSSTQSDNSQWLVKLLQQDFVQVSSALTLALNQKAVLFPSCDFSLLSFTPVLLSPPPDGLPA